MLKRHGTSVNDVNRESFPQEVAADSTRPGGHRTTSNGHQPPRNPRDNDSHSVCSPLQPSVRRHAKRHLRPLADGPGHTSTLRESTLPARSSHARKTHENQGSRRVSRAPDGRRTFHTAETPHAPNGDTAGRQQNHSAVERAVSGLLQRSRFSWKHLEQGPFGFVWWSSESQSAPDRLSHRSGCQNRR